MRLYRFDGNMRLHPAESGRAYNEYIQLQRIRCHLKDDKMPDADRFDAVLPSDRSGLTFRSVQGEWDYPLLLEINRSSRRADKDDSPVGLEDIAHALAHMEGMTPSQVERICNADGVEFRWPHRAPFPQSWMQADLVQPGNRVYYFDII
jgi:hypothetical protein